LAAEPFAFDRRWRFDVPPDELWRVLSRTGDFPRWWTWLDHFEADGLHAGASARFVVRPPLPYVLRFTVAIDHVEVARSVTTTVGGDLQGPARLEIEPDAGGSTARLVWSLRPHRQLLRRLAVVARPVLVWGHDRVVDHGVRQFRHRALPAARSGPS
jgi:uncharacterized protein YndB with AHSA1/START domain